jgi:uncharacterized protein (TIGR03067 family)
MRSTLLVVLLGGFVAAQGALQGDPKLVGTWQLVSGFKGNEKLPEEKAKGTMVVFDEKTITIKEAGRDEKADYKADPTAKPKTIDINKGDMPLAIGIYDLDGDNLKIIFTKGGGTRPKEFKEGGADSAMLILKRQK